MRVYRSEKDGIVIWKLQGAVGYDDACMLLRTLQDSVAVERGCFILDFELVEHIDYRSFRVLEDRFPRNALMCISGLNDYILDIFAFVRKRYDLRVFPDWRSAFRYLMTERGKIFTPAAAGSAL